MRAHTIESRPTQRAGAHLAADSSLEFIDVHIYGHRTSRHNRGGTVWLIMPWLGVDIRKAFRVQSYDSYEDAVREAKSYRDMLRGDRQTLRNRAAEARTEHPNVQAARDDVRNAFARHGWEQDPYWSGKPVMEWMP